MSDARLRWWILTLLFLGTTINYLDRIILGILLPDIRSELHISDTEYGFVTAAFQAAYTLGFLYMGRFVDRVGSRVAYGIAAVCWSAAAGLTVLARSAFQLGVWRSFLGLSESCNFPAAIKSVADWFEEKDRAFATGVFNSGTNVAAMAGPPIFVYLSQRYGWRACFLFTASMGILWVIAWMQIHPRFVKTKENLPVAISWGEAARLRPAWGFAFGKFFSDPAWWFYLFWLPLYLHEVRKLDMTTVGWALMFIYVMAGVGGMTGGWVSGRLIRHGWQPLRARKAAMLVCACSMPFTALGVLAPSATVAIVLFSLATGLHQAWSANLFTTVSDTVPRHAVGAVTGLGGFAGGLSGIIFSAIIPGYVIPRYGYTPVFLGMGVLYFAGLFALDRLTRRDELPRGVSV
ncbi:MAG TPA: MFS transporter [Bryobacteraceae bacterium]|nr:MFS transporter [Bryobacteraceae bacterium]